MNSIPDEVDKLHVFMDNCCGQGKNRYVFAFWDYIAQNRLQEVHLYFPIPGHSFMPIDRNFAQIEKKRLTYDKISHPSEIVNIVKTSQSFSKINGKHALNPFEVVYVKHSLTNNLQTDGTPVVDVKDYKRSLEKVLKSNLPGISTARGCSFVRGTNPMWRQTMSVFGNLSAFGMLKRGKHHANVVTAMTTAEKLIDFVPIKPAKVKDVKDLLKYVTLNEGTTFFSTLSGAVNAVDEDEDEYE